MYASTPFIGYCHKSCVWLNIMGKGAPGVTNDLSELNILLQDEATGRPNWVYPRGSHFYLRFEVSNVKWTCKIVKHINKNINSKKNTKQTN